MNLETKPTDPNRPRADIVPTDPNAPRCEIKPGDPNRFGGDAPPIPYVSAEILPPGSYSVPQDRPVPKQIEVPPIVYAADQVPPEQIKADQNPPDPQVLEQVPPGYSLDYAPPVGGFESNEVPPNPAMEIQVPPDKNGGVVDLDPKVIEVPLIIFSSETTLPVEPGPNPPGSDPIVPPDPIGKEEPYQPEPWPTGWYCSDPWPPGCSAMDIAQPIGVCGCVAA